MIIGIAGGGLLLCCALALLIFCLVRKKGGYDTDIYDMEKQQVNSDTESGSESGESFLHSQSSLGLDDSSLSVSHTTEESSLGSMSLGQTESSEVSAFEEDSDFSAFEEDSDPDSEY